MLLTITLWRLLAHPPSLHPVYKRAVASRSSDEWQTLKRVLTPIAVPLYIIGMTFICCAAASRSIGLYVIAMILFLALFNGTWYGARWAVSIAAQLTQERERQEWELLSLLPTGALGSAWALAAGSVHRNDMLRAAYRRRILMLRVLLVMIAVLCIMAVLNRRLLGEWNILLIYAYVVAASGASLIDFRQSAVLGTLTGMLAGLVTRHRMDSQVAAVGVLLLVQFASYALFAVMGFSVLPRLFEPLANHTLAEILLIVARLALFVGVREAALWVLWRIVSDRLNATTPQLAEFAAESADTPTFPILMSGVPAGDDHATMVRP